MDIFQLGPKASPHPLSKDSLNLDAEFFKDSSQQYLVLITPHEFIKLSDLFKFPQRAIQQTLDQDQFPNAEFYEDLLFIILNNLIDDAAAPERLISREINVFLGKSNLMIIYHGDAQELSYALDRIDKSSTYRALYTFIDAILDNDKRLIMQIEQNALELENEILSSAQVNVTNKTPVDQSADAFMDVLVEMRKELLFLKRYIEPTEDIIEILETDDMDLIPQEFHKYFLKLSLKADRLTSHLTNLSETIAHVRESWQAQVDLNFNKTARLFTVLASVFLPLTLITSWFGMNFELMPELSHPFSYPAVVIISVLLIGISLWWFRHNRYI